MRSAGLREWPRAPTGTVPTIPASGSNSNAASATGTRRRGGLWKPSAGRSLWRRTGGWSWRPPIPPRCRAVPVGTLRPTFLLQALREPTTLLWRRRMCLEAANVAEVVRLYALRNWIEQSYKQVKNALGWAHYQVRKDIS